MWGAALVGSALEPNDTSREGHWIRLEDAEGTFAGPWSRLGEGTSQKSLGQ